MKSWLMMLSAAAAHSGTGPVAGYRTTNGPALYLDAEMGPRVLGRRFQLAGLPPDAFHVADGFRLRLPQSKAKIAALIRATGARLVVMDSLRRLAPGAREDKSDDMSPIMACLAELSRDLDVAIVLIHHRSTKEGAAETRGSSAIEDQADIVLAFERAKDDPDERRRRLRTVKFRPDEEPAPTWVRIGEGFLFRIEEAEPFEADGAARARDDKRDEVLKVLGGIGRSERNIAAATGLARTTVQRALSDLASSGRAERRADGWVDPSISHPCEGGGPRPGPLGGGPPGPPSENGSTIGDSGGPPEVGHPGHVGHPENGAGWRPRMPDEDAPDWWPGGSDDR
jgi:hypothetical protein